MMRMWVLVLSMQQVKESTHNCLVTLQIKHSEHNVGYLHS